MHNKVEVLEVVRGDRVYRLYLDSKSPLGECYDVLIEMTGYVVERMKEPNNENPEVA